MTEILLFTGREVTPWLDDVARLRIEVFRDFPYLYDGDLAYERDYLASYAASPQSLFVLAIDKGQVVGASTGIPLSDTEAAFQTPFTEQGIALDRVFYFGESVLQKTQRGAGLGHRFFDEREKYARAIGKYITAFCAVERPDNHPLKPSGYTSLDRFWHARGYSKQAQMRTVYQWQDIDEITASDKPMVFWLKHWNAS